MFDLLFTPCHVVILEYNKSYILTSRQSTNRYQNGIFFWLIYKCATNFMS